MTELDAVPPADRSDDPIAPRPDGPVASQPDERIDPDPDDAHLAEAQVPDTDRGGDLTPQAEPGVPPEAENIGEVAPPDPELADGGDEAGATATDIEPATSEATMDTAATDTKVEPTIAEAATDTEVEPPSDEAPTATHEVPPSADISPQADLEPVAAKGPRTVGRFIADVLRTAGVRYAFTVPGESFLGLLDAFEGAGIRVIATRHEGAAGFMAEAHGQLTGRPAIALGTRGVGGTNLGIAIHTARQDSTPMFVAIGQVERRLLGREAFQEVDHVATIGGLAKWASAPGSAEEVAGTMAEAVRQALTGRPGPVVLSLAEDLLDEPMPDVHAETGRPAPPRASDDDIRAVIDFLASARRPVILAGGGVLRARTSTELTRFAELLHVPIIAAWRRADVVSNDHSLFLGMAGFGAARSVRERLDVADALLVIGSRLNEPTTYGYEVPREGLPWIHVDLAPGHATGSTAPIRVVAADAKAFLKSANDRLMARAVLDAERVEVRRTHNTDDRAAFEAASVVDAQPWTGPGVHPGRTVATLRRVLPDDAILTTDAGNFASWAGRGFRFRRPGTFLGPTSGAMGYGLPAAIAAALVHRDRPVVALVGDGGLGMTMAELETAVRVGARVIVVVFDNERYGTIRMWQDRRGTGLGVASDLGAVDFAAIARACGARGAKVERDGDFEPALRAALAADKATVIQVALDRAWLSIDQTPS